MLKTSTTAEQGSPLLDDLDSKASRSPGRVVPFWRAILIGAILVPISIYFGNYAYVVTQAIEWGQTALLRGPIFVLFLMALANLSMTRLFGRKAGLAASEMVVIYSMMAIATGISGFGMLQWLVNILPAGHYFPTSTNHYDRFVHLIPSYLLPTNPKVVHDFYIGHVSFLRPDILKDWASPVAVWSLFIVLMSLATLCLSSLVSRQWIRGERLTFPLVQLPLEMARDSEAGGVHGFFTNRLMWGGFILAGVMESIDYLNYMYPALPYIQIKPYHLEKLFTAAPWNATGMLATAIYPCVIGIAFLLSLEVSFSCWFFYLVTKAENVLSSALGLNAAGGMHGAYATAPYVYEQGAGAFIAFGIYLLWRVVKAEKEHGIEVSHGTSAPADNASLMSQKTALIVGGVCLGLLTCFLLVIGLPLWVVLAFWGIYLLCVTVLTRIVAEAGTGWAWGPNIPVHGIIMDTTGVSAMSSKTLTLFGLLSWFEVEFRDVGMPHQLEAVKMQQETNAPKKQMLWALIIAAVVGVVAGFATYLQIYYHFGAASANVRPALVGIGASNLSTVDNWLRNPRGVDHGAVAGMLAGAVVVMTLSLMRQKFVWWPLHPIGYALAGTQSMDYMWFPFLIGWAAKGLILRYGGAKMYRQALPFFLGLILGDYVVPTLWGFWGMITGTQVYMAFPH